MGTLTLYILKSIAISGILAAWYMFVLRGRSLHRYNRFFLLSALVASVVIPFLQFRSVNIPVPASGRLSPVSLIAGAATDSGGVLPLVQPASQVSVSWPMLTAFLVAGVSLFMLAMLLLRVSRLLLFCKRAQAKDAYGARLILTDHADAPFTFLHYLVWNKTMPLDDEMGRLILQHELAHVVQRHTYDKLFCQALTCIFWFNPFYWLIQKELGLVHEFIADEHAVTDRDTATFSMMLLHSYGSGSFLAPQHHFTTSPVRRRLAMLQNAATPSFATLRRFLALPILAGTVMLFSFSVHSGVPSSHIARAKKKLVILLDAAHGGKDMGGKHDGLSEKDVCLQYAQRIKELASYYNVEVRLTRKDDRYLTLPERVALSDKIRPDVFISLHVDEEPGTQKGKGDIDIYVSGKNAHAEQCKTYGSAIFQALEQNGAIPGTRCDHAGNTTCDNCNPNAAQQKAARTRATEKDGVYVLKNVRSASMVIVLGSLPNVQQVTGHERMNNVCNAILKGIVAGAEEAPRTGLSAPRRVPGGNILNTLQAAAATAPKCGDGPRTALQVNVADK
ncbi:hypothetical protein GCM10023093_19320 [Nemorincola caseinilytica]|uniref:N-acetylmuramoyl-L-alanine amidase n=1 Tax=Nemorincola caseinilytica TaxID=2054315 RepID=A0ABP8NII4_9BACT